MTQLLLNTPAQVRRRFINSMAEVVGVGNVRAFWVASEVEGLVVPDAIVSGLNWTHGQTPTGRVSKLGKGAAVSFASASSNYLATPDRAGLTFGTGAADNPFSIFTVAKITDTAAVRNIFSKYETSNIEYQFAVDATDHLLMLFYDNSAAVAATRTSSGTITQGSWVTLAASYDGTGGATAANGAKVYQNGAEITSAAGNNAAYVAMEDKVAEGAIGTAASHATQFLDGFLACVLVWQRAPVAQHYADLTQLARTFYGIN